MEDHQIAVKSPEKHEAKAEDRPMNPRYLEHLEALAQNYPPAVGIAFQNLSYKVPIPKRELEIPNIAKAYRNSAFGIGRKFLKLGGGAPHGQEYVEALSECSGVIRAGTMTLILAPPGHGKTTLLRCLASINKPKHAGNSKVYYNGKTADQLRASGISLPKLFGFVEQRDLHMSLMTVKETFQFANDSSVVDTSLMSPAPKSNKVDTIIDVLGLKECENTIVGNNLIRGVSGGQKKRTTIGEILVGETRVLFLDEISVGLDAASTYEIFAAIKLWAMKTQGTVVASLLQPTPEVFQLFDDLIMLRMGNVVYHGPIGAEGVAVKHYLTELGIPVPYDMDLADFIQEFLTDPINVYERTRARLRSGIRRKQRRGASSDPVPVPVPEEDGYETKSLPPLTTAELRAEWAAREQKPPTDGPGITLTTPFARAQYSSDQTHSFFRHLSLNMKRQNTLMSRNKGLFMPRVMQSIFMGLVLGSLFYMMSPDNFYGRLGICMTPPIFVTFGNMQEIPVALESKRVVKKQLSYSFYPIMSYLISVVTIHFPLLFTETVALTTIVYWMTGFAVDGVRYIAFVGILICHSLAMSTWFRFIAYASPTEISAQTKAGPTTSIFLLFGGFLITRKKVRDYLIWLYWFSPFSWTVRALAINEFSDPRYDNTISQGSSGNSGRAGDVYLETLEFFTDTDYIWAAPVVLVGYFFIFVWIARCCMLRHTAGSGGTKRISQEEEEAEYLKMKASNVASAGAFAIEMHNVERRQISETEVDPTHYAAAGGIAGDELPFVPTNIAFEDLEYSVDLPNGKMKPLLRGVTAYARAGELTALMGASGAGKTTLLDVIAGRKTAGDIKGRITVNGVPQELNSFRRLAGYVEQHDLHIGFATVREALEFSAKLRLPVSVTEQQRKAFIDQVMHDLELTALADRLIGDHETGVLGLSPGQMKRLTIGVELVANPSIIFLDEPTSGLDSREALQVVRVIKKIARKGRTVICTIHQPSAEVFSRFDNLLLLQSGGHQVFFGKLGDGAQNLVDYFESVGNTTMPLAANPATWMLEVLGDRDDHGGGEHSKLADEYKARSKEQFEETRRIASPEGAAPALAHDKDAKQTPAVYPGFSTQFRELMKRGFVSHWRNLPYNFTRSYMFPLLGVIFGIVYFNVSLHDQAGILSAIASVFMTTAFCGVINAATAMPVMIGFRDVYYRERFSNTYSPYAYSWMLCLCEIPFAALWLLLFNIAFYYLAGFENDANLFFKWWLATTLLSYCFVYWTFFLSSVLPNAMVANIFQGLSFSFMFLFGGVFIRAPDIPRGWLWMYYINPVPKAVRAIVGSQFQHSTRMISVVGQEQSVHDYVSGYLDDDLDTYWQWIGWLIFTVVIIAIWVSLALRFVVHIKR